MTRDPGPPRGLLQRPTAAGHFEHERIAPTDERLAAFVAHFWWVRWDLRGLPAQTTATLPHPTVHLVFESRAQVCGVPTGPFRRRLVGEDRAFGIKFRPAAFHPWFGAPVATLTDRRRPLRSVFGPAAVPLARAIRAAPSFAACIALAEPFLLARVPALPAPVVTIRDLVERMQGDPQITRAETAATLVGLDLRTLQRRFTQLVGVSPKWVIQRYRLHEAAAQLLGPAPPTLAALAARLGYFDQAHFARDFKAVVGKAPSHYLAR